MDTEDNIKMDDKGAMKGHHTTSQNPKVRFSSCVYIDTCSTMWANANSLICLAMRATFLLNAKRESFLFLHVAPYAQCWTAAVYRFKYFLDLGSSLLSSCILQRNVALLHLFHFSLTFDGLSRRMPRHSILTVLVVTF